MEAETDVADCQPHQYLENLERSASVLERVKIMTVGQAIAGLATLYCFVDGTRYWIQWMKWRNSND
jgi:hypothetical protein